MPDRPAAGAFTPGYVEARLEAAGQTLLALPWAGCFPSGFKNLWTDDATGGRRYPLPTPQAISDMDEAYRWAGLATDLEERRLVLMRSLVLPDSDTRRQRYVWSWRRLRHITGLHVVTLQGRWGRGIDHITAALNRPGLCAASGGSLGIPCRSIFQRRHERMNA